MVVVMSLQRCVWRRARGHLFVLQCGREFSVGFQILAAIIRGEVEPAALMMPGVGDDMLDRTRKPARLGSLTIKPSLG
jgi:hypothetical protein